MCLLFTFDPSNSILMHKPNGPSTNYNPVNPVNTSLIAAQSGTSFVNSAHHPAKQYTDITVI